jgi:PAS domain S-box-containing protein
MYIKIKKISFLICFFISFSTSIFSQEKFDSLLSVYDEHISQNGNSERTLEIIKELYTESFKSDPFLASEYAAMGKQIAEELGDSIQIAIMQNYIGNTYFKEKVYYLAMESYFIAYEIFSEYDDNENLALCLINVGKTYAAQEIFDIAEEYFFKAKDLYEKLDNQAGVSTALVNLGLANMPIDEEMSLEYFYQAIEIQQQINEPLLLAETKRYIGLTHNQLYETELALQSLNEALDIFIISDNLYELAETYFAFGEVFLEDENFEFAKEYYFKALEIYEEIPTQEKIAEIYNNLGEISLNQQHAVQAIDYSMQALEIAQIYNLLELQRDAYYVLTTAYENQSDFEMAFMMQKEYASLVNQIFEQKKREQFSEFQMSMETQQQQKEIELLEINSEKDKLELAQKQYKRNTFYVIIIALLILSFIIVIYYRYREKLKANLLLEESNKQLVKEVEVRRIAEAELKNSEEKLRLLFRKTPIGIMQYDESMRITTANDRFAQIFKIDRRQIIDADLTSIFDRNVIYSFSSAFDSKGQVVREEREVITKGEVVFVSMTIKPYFYTVDQDVIKGGIVIVEDLTEKKKAEKLSDKNMLRKQILMDVFPDRLILANKKGEIIETHIPDNTEEEPNIKYIKDLFDDEILENIFGNIKKSIESRKFIIYKYSDPSNRKNFEARFIPESKENTLIIIREIDDAEMGNFEFDKQKSVNIESKKLPKKFAEDVENEIEKIIIPIYRNIQKNLSFILIKGFAEQIKLLGMKFKEENIENFGDQLLDYVTNFNVVKVNEMINRFPSFVSKYMNTKSIDF